MSSIGNDTAATIVETDTLALIARADNIVKNCTGTNCNVSDVTRTSITQNLSKLAQEQSMATLILLSISTSSIIGREIYEAYLNLGAAVASVYNFQCGNNVNNTTCVTNATSVKTAQNNLENLLVQPATNEANHIVVVSILLIIGIIAFILFFIFLIIGLFETMFEASAAGAAYASQLQTQEQPTTIQLVQPVQPVQIQPVVQKVAVPASPFDITEPVYE
jgi:hypothetical protein